MTLSKPIVKSVVSISRCLKILESDLKHGALKLVVEFPEDVRDLWLLIRPGDLVFARTRRSVKIGGARAERRPMVLGIRIEKVDLELDACCLRLLGRVEHHPEGFEVKGYHAFSVRPGSVVTIVKDRWTDTDLQRLKRAIERREVPPIYILAIDDSDYALAMVQENRTSIVDSGSLPPATEYVDLVKRAGFLIDRISELVKQRAGPVVVGGPAILVDAVFKAVRENLPSSVPVIKTGLSSGGEAGVYEALRRQEVRQALAEHRALMEQQLVEEFLAALRRGEPIAYGIDLVEQAALSGAVKHLLVSNTLFTKPEILPRLLSILDAVEQHRGAVTFITMHREAIQTLDGFGGLLAYLRYPLPSTYAGTGSGNSI